MDDRPWEALPPRLGPALRRQIPQIEVAIAEAVAREVPGYVAGTPAADRLQAGTTYALSLFADLIDRPLTRQELDQGLLAELGRRAHEDGRTGEDLSSIFSIAARASLRSIEHATSEIEIDSAEVIRFAEAIFVYTEQVAALAAEGYASAEREAIGELQASREQLLSLLLIRPPVARGVLARAAERARWPVPRQLAAIALGPDEPASRIAARIGADVLAGSFAGAPCLIVPDPDAPGRTGAIEMALQPAKAAIGATTPVARAAQSLDWARRTLELMNPEPGRSAPRAEDHLAELALTAEGELLDALAQKRLAPLQTLTPAARRRLEETLLAWLTHGRSAPAAAAALHTHPQTVRYRLNQIREALGAAIDDPDQAFEIQLALRAKHLRTN
jgi:hypothetical protein